MNEPVLASPTPAGTAPPRHVVINGLSVGSGGGYTVARELWRHLAIARPDWRFTLALVSGNKLHASIKSEAAPANCEIFWAPPHASDRRHRGRYERTGLADWIRHTARADAVLQLNGMMIPGLTLPTLVHHQDPYPYRPEAWSGLRDRFVSLLKRRAHAYALRHADCMGWTSGYLRDTVCAWLRIQPRRSEVLYNGLPDEWLARARADLPAWTPRPMQIVSVSNVSRYKRQDLIIRALPDLLKRPGMQSLTYRIAGNPEGDYPAELQQLARSLGVQDRVVLEGRVSDQRVTELLSGSRAFVLMSVCESFGIPAVEAMSWGTPVVTSDCCAMPEVCGNAADLVPVDDVPALADRIYRVLTDPPHAEELRRLGAERVQRFAWATTAGRMAQILEQIMR
jgi:glycosyltransferase involved in cell wall biosynthesis